MICPLCGSSTESVFKCGSCGWEYKLECPYCAVRITEVDCLAAVMRSVNNVTIKSPFKRSD